MLPDIVTMSKSHRRCRNITFVLGRVYVCDEDGFKSEKKVLYTSVTQADSVNWQALFKKP